MIIVGFQFALMKALEALTFPLVAAFILPFGDEDTRALFQIIYCTC